MSHKFKYDAVASLFVTLSAVSVSYAQSVGGLGALYSMTPLTVEEYNQSMVTVPKGNIFALSAMENDQPKTFYYKWNLNLTELTESEDETALSDPKYLFSYDVLKGSEAGKSHVVWNGATETAYYLDGEYGVKKTEALHNAANLTSVTGKNGANALFYNQSVAPASSLLSNDATFKIDSIAVDFVKNDVIDAERTLLDNKGTIGTMTGNFIGNNGGWLVTNRTASAKINSIEGKFIGNDAFAGSPIIYNAGTIGTVSGEFANNNMAQGIENIGTIGDVIANFVSNDFRYNAIRNEKGVMGNISGAFIGNRPAENVISNRMGMMKDISALFADNRTHDGNVITLYRPLEVGTITGHFSNNKARPVYTFDSSLKITDSNFLNNQAWLLEDSVMSAPLGAYDLPTEEGIDRETALANRRGAVQAAFEQDEALAMGTAPKFFKASQGGAVYFRGASNQTLSVLAEMQDSIFTGNTVYKEAEDKTLHNDIYMKIENPRATEDPDNLVLGAKSNRLLSFGSGINGTNYSVSVNPLTEHQGTVRLHDIVFDGADSLTVHHGVFDIESSAVKVAGKLDFKKESTFQFTITSPLNTSVKAGNIILGDVATSAFPKAKVHIPLDSLSETSFRILEADTILGQFDVLENPLFNISYRTDADSGKEYGVFLVTPKTTDPTDPIVPPEPTDPIVPPGPTDPVVPPFVPPSEGIFAGMNSFERAWFGSNAYPADSYAKNLADYLFYMRQDDEAKFRELQKEVQPTRGFVLRTLARETNRWIENSIQNVLDGTVREVAGFYDDEGVNKVWTNASFGYQSYEGDAEFNGHRKAIIAGADTLIGRTLTTGIGASYEENDLSYENRNTNVKGFSVFGYARYDATYNLRFDTSLSYGKYTYDETGRQGLNDAEYDVNVFGANLIGTYDLFYHPMQGLMSLKAGARYNMVKQEEYTDKAGQFIEKENMNTATLLAGVSASRPCYFDHWMMLPSIDVFATYDVTDDTADRSVWVKNGLKYDLVDEELEKFGVETELQMEWISDGMWNLSVSYNGAYKKDYNNHSFTVRGKLDF